MPSTRRVFALVLGLAALALLVALRVPVITHVDAAVSAAAGRFTVGHGSVRGVATGVTHSADPLPLRVLLVAGLGLTVALRRWRLAGYILAVTLVGTGARIALLHIVARPRPVDRLVEASGYSFPSGHTTSSAIAAGAAIVLGFTLVRATWGRRAIVAVALAWTGLVGLSRIVLVAHWPTDVIGGWLLAAAVVVSLHPLTRKDHYGSADSAAGSRRRGPRWLRRTGARAGGATERGIERPGGAAERRGELPGRGREPVAEDAAT